MKNKILNESQEKEIINLYTSGLSMKNIGIKFKVSKQTISRALKRNDIKNKSPHVLSKKEEIYVIDLYEKLKSVPLISKKLKVSNTAIYNSLKRNNIKIEKSKYNVDESFFENIDSKKKHMY